MLSHSQRKIANCKQAHQDHWNDHRGPVSMHHHHDPSLLSVRERLCHRLGLAPNQPTDNEQDHSESKETHVPGQLVRAGTHMMKTENLVIENAFNHVEIAPARQYPGPQDARTPHLFGVIRSRVNKGCTDRLIQRST